MYKQIKYYKGSKMSNLSFYNLMLTPDYFVTTKKDLHSINERKSERILFFELPFPDQASAALVLIRTYDLRDYSYKKISSSQRKGNL